MKMNNSSFAKSCIYALSLVAVAVITLTGIKVIPKGIKYNVKETQANMSVNTQTNVSAGKYEIRSFGKKICVVLDGNIMYELDITTDSVSEFDRNLLKDGITLKDENELYSLKEYLES